MTGPDQAGRRIVHRTRGHAHGPITRLMSPSDLGQTLKPFVFLDIVSSLNMKATGMGLHPHSGISTVTVFTDGDTTFDDGEGNTGTIGYGGVEWMRAGRGVWHGQEIGAGKSPTIDGFQLWLALPAELELAPQESQYLEASSIPETGPARLVVGAYAGAQSPVRSWPGVNYLLVTLKPGDTWRYETPAGHTIGWFAVAKGEVTLDTPVTSGEMVVLDTSDSAIELRSTGKTDATLVIGTAVPHPHDLHLGYYSVHTSAESLAQGEQHIATLRKKLIEREKLGNRLANGSVPVLR